ncbi:MAG: hypothetical protein IJO18_04945 [Alphaproteobacteria bacterium]|nr:hypothetical protein [Alphaproteobacteria bacterium]
MKNSIIFADWRVTLLFIMSYFVPIYNTDAAAPATECPTGYITISKPDVILANTSCPSGYVSVGTVSSCLVANPAGNCFMYAPAGVSYTDASGTYEFTEACEMEESSS